MNQPKVSAVMREMQRDLTITFKGGDWWVIVGQLTGEWAKVREDPNRQAYAETLQRMRLKIFDALNQ